MHRRQKQRQALSVSEGDALWAAQKVIVVEEKEELMAGGDVME